MACSTLVVNTNGPFRPRRPCSTAIVPCDINPMLFRLVTSRWLSIDSTVTKEKKVAVPCYPFLLSRRTFIATSVAPQPHIPCTPPPGGVEEEHR